MLAGAHRLESNRAPCKHQPVVFTIQFIWLKGTQPQGQQSWVGMTGEGFVVVGRQRRGRGLHSGRSQLGGIGIIFQPKHQPSLPHGLAPAPSPLSLSSSHPIACVATSLPSDPTGGHTFIMPSAPAALCPTPPPGRVICYTFCSQAHFYTDTVWGMPVGQY